MTTEVVKTIRASGGDYTTLSAWEAALPASLVTADEQHTAVCYNDWPSGLDDTVSISGSTTDSTRYIKVSVASGHRHDGTPQTGFHIKGDSGGATTPKFTVDVSYSVIDGVDVDNTRAAQLAYGFNTTSTSAPGIIYYDCIGRSNTGKAFASNSGTNYSSTRTTFIGCLAHDSGQGFARTDTVRSRYNAYNCVAANCDVGFASGSTNKAAIKNCVAYNSSTIDFENQVDATNSGYNASSDSSASVFTGGVTGISSDDFVDAANNDFHLAAGSALIGAGANLYSKFTTDIDGDARPASGAWDIGFDHYVSTGGTIIETTAAGRSVARAACVAGKIAATTSAAAIAQRAASTAGKVGAASVDARITPAPATAAAKIAFTASIQRQSTRQASTAAKSTQASVAARTTPRAASIAARLAAGFSAASMLAVRSASSTAKTASTTSTAITVQTGAVGSAKIGTATADAILIPRALADAARLAAGWSAAGRVVVRSGSAASKVGGGSAESRAQARAAVAASTARVGSAAGLGVVRYVVVSGQAPVGPDWGESVAGLSAIHRAVAGRSLMHRAVTGVSILRSAA